MGLSPRKPSGGATSKYRSAVWFALKKRGGRWPADHSSAAPEDVLIWATSMVAIWDACRHMPLRMASTSGTGVPRCSSCAANNRSRPISAAASMPLPLTSPTEIVTTSSCSASSYQSPPISNPAEPGRYAVTMSNPGTTISEGGNKLRCNLIAASL